MRSLRLILLIAFFCQTGNAQLPPRADPPRSWTTVQGETFQAAILSFDGNVVVLKAADGRRFQKVPADFVHEDQDYLADWRKKQPIKVVMPETVAVETANIKTEVVSEDEKSESYVYRTPHFEFESQGKLAQSLLREVARNFEVTYELLKVLPWEINPKPPEDGHYRARLIRSMKAYHASGGPKNSGGYFNPADNTFYVPFESLGLKTMGKSYVKASDFDHRTMIHELTHQMMGEWLLALPIWVTEGTAEYVANLPLQSGRFRVSAAKTGLKDYLDYLKTSGGGTPQPFPLDKLFFMTPQEWNQTLVLEPGVSRRLYFTSYLLVYYFMHLDGGKDGQLFVRYLREVNAMRQQMKDYLVAFDEFSKMPGVEKTKDGGFKWQGDLKPPVQPPFLLSVETLADARKATLNILLNGRTEAELTEQIRVAYSKLGIRL